MDYLKIGFVKKPHGIKGEVKILPLTSDINRFKKLKNIYLFLNDVYVETEIQWIKIADSDVIMKFAKFNRVEDVEFLRNVYLFLKREDGIPLSEWEFYSQDVIDCDVYYQNNFIGKVVDLSNFGANDNLLIEHNGKEVFFPFLRQYIEKIDIEKKRIEINQIEGFFD
ncbi:MAG: 16S rRNA processing protein RimM [Spirochaetes bacterium GWD1_27_9]|nr:MAG: 16S rRNA processing protein RimM [Spirochaetes bacterium GWB1_27_13]OHD24574.1 MAG: 16S rRNA processing protein RimM [Spirochaetes bacterium GWC1_27_15]OHD45574.1 MAG: 16S rRNA processing protein RimM [Spirochaetes bacterium GWD1_27_9]